MARDFERGEQIKRPPSILGQQNDTTQQLKSSRNQRQNRPVSSWQNRGLAWRAWEDDTPLPIPEHLKTDAWIDRYLGSPANALPDQNQSSEDNNAVQSIAAAPKQQQSDQGQQPHKVAQASVQPEGAWLNSGVSARR
jgi:hypothetical protein